MNTTTPYENLIAAKLEQVQVPDMADSIWASIEMQLDADLPSDDGDDAPSKDPTKGKPGMGKGFYFPLFSVIIIVVLLFYKTNKKQSAVNNNLPVLPKTTTTAPVADSNQSIKNTTEKNANTSLHGNKKDTIANPFSSGNRLRFDSAFGQPSSLSKYDSSSLLLKNKPALPSFDSGAAPLIKPKGVKGITNDDYRIYGKKDSAKKGG